MKKTLVLHIGMGKTGTTALQQFFWSNKTELLRQDISYPKYGTMAQAHHLLSPYRPPELRNQWKFKAVAEWGPILQKSRTETVLISSELIAWASAQDVLEFCNSAQQLFDLKVVVYLRRQDNMIMANFNQLVKAGSQKQELDWVLENEPNQFDYQKLLAPWVSALGKDRIIVRPYEKLQFWNGDIRWDFLYHVFGLDSPGNFLIPRGNPNPRFSLAAMEFKLQLNRLFGSSIKSSRFNAPLLAFSAESDAGAQKVYSSQSLLAPLTRQDIVQRSSAGNARIAREFMDRSDGKLFYEPLPENTATWIKPVLSDADAREITRYLHTADRLAYQALVSAVRRGARSLSPMRREAAGFFRPLLPASEFGSVAAKDRPTETSLWNRLPFRRERSEDPLLLVSVHFPAVVVPGYQALIEDYFHEFFLRDYEDRPIRFSAFQRNFRALENCVRLAGLAIEAEQDTCVHGHFLPLKYRLLSSRFRKRYVTWMQDPVERLAGLYFLWKASDTPAVKGGLHHRLLEEEWSLETFFFLPEIRNIYSKYLWGFPLSSFDFIGIPEFHDAEVMRFSTEILGRPLPDQWVETCPEKTDYRSTLSPELLARVERYHAADMSLYRRALKIRAGRIRSSG